MCDVFCRPQKTDICSMCNPSFCCLVFALSYLQCICWMRKASFCRYTATCFLQIRNVCRVASVLLLPSSAPRTRHAACASQRAAQHQIRMQDWLNMLAFACACYLHQVRGAAVVLCMGRLHAIRKCVVLALRPLLGCVCLQRMRGPCVWHHTGCGCLSTGRAALRNACIHLHVYTPAACLVCQCLAAYCNIVLDALFHALVSFAEPACYCF